MKRLPRRTLLRLIPLALPFLSATCAHQEARFELASPVPAVDGDGFDGALFQSVGARLLPGHRWEIANDAAVFDRHVEAIDGARSSVDIVIYIWHSGTPSDRVVAALARRRGIACRVVADAVGSPDFTDKVAPALRAAGCDTRIFRPLTGGPSLDRNHRKIIVVDGRVGFVGGFGIRKEWLGGAATGGDAVWRDTSVRIEGPAVHDLQRAFAQNWQEAGGALLPPAEFPEAAATGGVRVAAVTSTAAHVTDAARLTALAVGAARHRLWIWNAYFIPDAALLSLLARKGREGVDVRLLLPGDKNDVKTVTPLQRKTYPELRAAGVRVFEYAPAMMHAKVTLVDDRIAVIGSINLDAMSLRWQEESAVVIEDSAIVTALARDWEADAAHCKEVTAR